MSSTYNTKQRQLILSLLTENKEKQFTCEEIEENLRKNGTPVGKATVYRYLISMQNEGKVRKFKSEQAKSATFSFVENKEECNHHLHLKCLSCGAFTHLDCEVINDINAHLIKDHHFRIDNSKTVIYGFCGKCNTRGE